MDHGTVAGTRLSRLYFLQQERADELQEQACRASGSILAAGRRWSSPELSHRDQNFPSVNRARRVDRRSRPRHLPRSPPRRGRLRPRWQHFPRGKAENAELRTTLAVRDAVIGSLEVRLAEHATAADDLAARLAASEAELASLRREIAELRDVRSFEAKRALFQADPAEPSAARIEVVRSEARDLDAIFDAAKAPAGLPPPPEADSVAIHFDFASSRLTPGGQIHAAAAAVLISALTIARVRLVGHTDRVGGPAANRRLAARRAAAVADFLVRAGVPRDLIDIDDKGEADLPVATADGVPEPLNRSVEISILPL